MGLVQSRSLSRQKSLHRGGNQKEEFMDVEQVLSKIAVYEELEMAKVVELVNNIKVPKF